MAKGKNKEIIMTPTFEVAFPAVATPKKNSRGNDKYSVTMLFDKPEDLKELKRIALAIAKEKYGDKAEEMIKEKVIKWPFKTGKHRTKKGLMEELYPNFKDKVYVDASTQHTPVVVDQKKQPILDVQGECYAGSKFRALVHAFHFDTDGNEGIAFGLSGLQKVADGEKRGFNAANLFDEVAAEEQTDNLLDDLEL